MKNWYNSKTLWVNLIAVVGIMVQTYTGKDFLPTEVQASMLGIINLALRVVTKEEVKW